ncbi:MAG: hypothetical protein QXT10_03210 [Candidatus Bathyarchaeia archaeon]
MSEVMLSLEKVHYDLGGVHGLKEKSKTYIRLLETLQRLPSNIYEFAIKNILFVDASSKTIPLNQLKALKKKYVIILEKNISNFGIAHEIAHAKLNHKAFWESSLEQEDEADKLAESWGFKHE